MAIRIDHGPPGSFKTSSVIQNFLLPALANGAHIITNARSFNDLDIIRKYYPVHDSSEITYLETSHPKDLKKLREWFQWAPKNAFIMLDETQVIYPSTGWHPSDVDYVPVNSVPITTSMSKKEADEAVKEQAMTEATELGIPWDIEYAFSMHRHFGWTIFLTTTNINKVNKLIRESSEQAFLHKALGSVGLPKFITRFFGDFSEVQHHPMNSGLSKSHQIGKVQFHKVDPNVFKIYKSTLNEDANESFVGRKQKANNLKYVFYALAIFLAYLIYRSSTIDEKGVDNDVPSAQSPAVVAAQKTTSENTSSGRAYPPIPAHNVLSLTDALSSVFNIHLIDSVHFESVFGFIYLYLEVGPLTYVVDQKDLMINGFAFVQKNNFLSLTYGETDYMIAMKPDRIEHETTSDSEEAARRLGWASSETQ